MLKLKIFISALLVGLLMFIYSCESDKFSSTLRSNSSVKVGAYTKISQTSGKFYGALDVNDCFGRAVCSIGDLDNDGITDIAVGAHDDDDGGTNRGAVWILFLDTDGTVKSYQKISDTAGNFNDALSDNELADSDHFGYSLCALGDLDGDGVEDIAVGALDEDDGGTDAGTVWILFLNSDGSVRFSQKITEGKGGFAGSLGDSDNFGISVCSIGDLNNDGVIDIAVGAHGDDDGGTDRGAVWILFLNSDGTVKTGGSKKISDTSGNFVGVLDDNDNFGMSLSYLDDLNGDGILDIAVGAPSDDDGNGGRGAVWILFLDTDGTVKNNGDQKISDTQGDFTGVLDDDDYLGSSICNLGDLNNDGITDIGVGAYCDDDGGTNIGAVWVLFLNTNGTVKSYQKISDTEGSFNATIHDGVYFGSALCSLGDLNNDGITDLGVGAYLDDEGGTNMGAVYNLFLNRVY